MSAGAPPPEVVLNMAARAEGVGVVRQALAGVADALAFDAAVLSDMKMAVTEACTNVVVHAYDEEAGQLEVAMLAGDEDLTIVVRDHGTGIQPRPTREGPPALGLGLPLIAALTDAFELRGSAGQGTEVRMTFAYVRDSDPASANPVTGLADAGSPDRSATKVIRTSAPAFVEPLSSNESDRAAISGSPSPSAGASRRVGRGWMPLPQSRTTIVSAASSASISTSSVPSSPS